MGGGDGGMGDGGMGDMGIGDMGIGDIGTAAAVLPNTMLRGGERAVWRLLDFADRRLEVGSWRLRLEVGGWTCLKLTLALR
jgi:hypothetical protein